MSMNKIADVQLETTAEYQDLSKLNVKFWNQDKNTATLKFNITRNNYPLSLSEENVKVFIALESGDSFLVDDNLDYVDELNGVVAYTIPDNFMRVAKNVTGQVYVTTLDGEEVVVQRQFTFTVANDLIADLPAEDKIREIKYFSDMRAEVAQMMEKLNNDFANMNDYVTQVEQTTQDGITALTNLIQQKQDAYNANHTAKMKELNDKGSEYSSKFDDDKVYIDEKSQEFKDAVIGSGLVTVGDSQSWQKYKLTSDDGTYPLIDLQNKTENFYGLKTGVYYTTNTPHGISGVSTAGFSEMKINQEETVKRLTFRPYNSNRIFEKWFYNEWSEWHELVTTKDVSQIETIQGSIAKANTAENNAKVYTDGKISSINKVLFEGTANGVGTTINLSETLDNFIILYFYGTFPGGQFNDLGNPYTTSKISLTPINLIDSDGNGGGIYEISINKTTRTQLTISNDIYFDLGKLEGSGANANRCTITRIVGVRK